MYAWGTWIGIV